MKKVTLKINLYRYSYPNVNFTQLVLFNVKSISEIITSRKYDRKCLTKGCFLIEWRIKLYCKLILFSLRKCRESPLKS